MKITNNLNLPSALLRAAESHEHYGADYSATQLLRSPRHLWLSRRHETTEDLSGMIWAVFGTALHQIIASGEGAKEFAESYLEQKVGDVTVSGTVDLYDFEEKKISDWKSTSVYSIIYGSRNEDWEQQLNIYAWLMRSHGFQVEKLEIVAILRDWQRSKAKFDPSYPQTQVVKIDIPLWHQADAQYFVESQVAELEKHKDTPDASLPLCSDEYRWKNPAKFAVMKQGRKSAIKLHDNPLSAEQHAATVGGSYVEHRPSEARRCADYCAVADFCSQYQKEERR